MDVAPAVFFAGIFLGLFCGFRILVRTFQWAETWRRWPRGQWDSFHVIVRLRLRHTAGLEVIGFVAAIATIIMVIPHLKPG